MTQRSAPHAGPVSELLHVLRVKGIASESSLTTAIGWPAARVKRLLGAEEHRGNVAHRTRPVPSWSLTPAGRELHDRWISTEREGLDRSPVSAAHQSFLRLNEPFKRLCTDWQLGGDTVAASDGLADVDARLQVALAAAAGSLPRLRLYADRLAASRGRFEAGDTSALTRPLSDSYHDVWMELHQDLLLTLGLTRSAADGA